MRLFLPSLALSLASLAAAQRTYIVDTNGRGDCTDIQTCVNRAATGDRVLVRPGAYGGFTVTTAIMILGDGSATVSVSGPIVIQNLRGGQTVMLGGMKVGFATQPQTPTSVLSILGVSTAILADLDVDPGQPANARTTTEAAGIYVEKSSVVLSRVTSKGSDGTIGPAAIQPGTGGAGLACLSSTVAASGSTFTGGAGGAAPQGNSAPGGEGCFAQQQSFVVLDGTSAIGGTGAFFTPSTGGDGVHLDSSTLWVGSSAADHLDGGATANTPTTPLSAGLRAVNGSRASHFLTTITAGHPNGQAIVFDRSSSVGIQSHPALTGISPVPRGSSAVYTVSGEQQKAAVLFLGLDAAPLTVPGIETPFWLPGPRGLLLFLGAVVVGSSGSVDLKVQIPLDPTLADRFLAVEGIGWLDGPPFVATAVAVTVIR